MHFIQLKQCMRRIKKLLYKIECYFLFSVISIISGKNVLICIQIIPVANYVNILFFNKISFLTGYEYICRYQSYRS